MMMILMKKKKKNLFTIEKYHEVNESQFETSPKQIVIHFDKG